MTISRLCAVTATTGAPATVYTSSGTTVVKSITLCNIVAATAKVTITMAGKNVLYNYEVGTRSTIVLSTLDVVLANNETITVVADTASSVDILISGRTAV